MARYKHDDYAQTKLLPVNFDRQLLPGTFAYTLNYLMDEKIDLSVFAARYKNDEGGAPAHAPAMLRKLTLCAYSKGSMHRRQIEQLCRENVVCMALSADTTPHCTTIAAFVSSLSAEITTIFRHSLLGCDAAGLIGREMFALDGVKLPANASKEWSGTKTDLQQQAQTMHAAVEHLVSPHCANDARDAQGSLGKAAERQRPTWHAAIAKSEGLLATHADKLGMAGTPKQSNLTDNESAKMPPSTGVLQGDNGVAIAASKHPGIVHAEAFGEGQEHGLLQPMLEGVREPLQQLTLSEDMLTETKLTADAGYASEANAAYLCEQGIDA